MQPPRATASEDNAALGGTLPIVSRPLEVPVLGRQRNSLDSNRRRPDYRAHPALYASAFTGCVTREPIAPCVLAVVFSSGSGYWVYQEREAEYFTAEWEDEEWWTNCLCYGHEEDSCLEVDWDTDTDLEWEEPKRREHERPAACATITVRRAAAPARVFHAESSLAAASANATSGVPSASATVRVSHAEGSIIAAHATATSGVHHTDARSALATDSIAFAGGASVATGSISTARIALAGGASLFTVSIAAASVGIGGGPPTVAATHGSIVAPVSGPGL
ncbi:UNVERIFIED_CONTAM: hypothetical protein FKN15_031919 [Acipenser sinensis]